MTKDISDNNIPFLRGGGEMGKIIREKDWQNTLLGNPESWPQSLKNILNLMLNSKFPMFLWWGTDLICFYNDAYRPSLGQNGKHPSIVGIKAEEAWFEIWTTIQPLINHVILKEEAVWSEDQLIPIYRNGKLEDVYWTFSYSPVYDVLPAPVGVLVTCTETTSKVIAARDLFESKNELEFAIEATGLGTWDYNPLTNIFIANERLKTWFGLAFDDEIELTDAINAILENDKERVVHAIQKALDFSSGGKYDITYSIVHPKTKIVTIVRAKGKAWFNNHKIAYRFNGTLEDITAQANAAKKLEENEKKFRLLADSMPQQIWTSDTAGNLNYFNQSVFNYSGFSSEEIFEKGWLQIVHPDDREKNIETWQQAIKNGTDFILEHRFRHYSGEYRWQLSRAIPQKDLFGNIQMWVGSSTDIHEQKIFAEELEKRVKERTKELIDANEALLESETRYHLMVEEVQDYAILYLDRQGIVKNWNAGAEKIKGYKAVEIIGKSFSNFYTESDRQDALPQKLLTLAANSGKALQEGWRVRKDGSLFWASVVITAVHDKNNAVIGFSKVTHDLTEKKNAEDQLKKYAAQLEQKNNDLQEMNKELQSFAYISSHDLQEPLRKIQTFSSRILDTEFQNLSSVSKDYFNRIQDAALRMQTLIDDLLAYSRTSSAERNFEKIDLNIIVNEIRKDLMEEIEQKNAHIELINSCELQIIPFQFRQLLQNLISNSLKFTSPERLPEIKINCSVEKTSNLKNTQFSTGKNYCHLRISDNGIGFDQKYNEKIFELFQRLHGKSEYNGTGIGLAIVKKIVENHHGFITASGELNKGATFDIYIPAK